MTDGVGVSLVCDTVAEWSKKHNAIMYVWTCSGWVAYVVVVNINKQY